MEAIAYRSQVVQPKSGRRGAGAARSPPAPLVGGRGAPRRSRRPAPAAGSVRPAAAATPCRAAFSRSTSNDPFGLGLLTNQSTSTTPSVVSKISSTCRASLDPRILVPGRRSRPPGWTAPAVPAGSPRPSPRRRGVRRSPGSRGRIRLAMAWLCSSRSLLVHQVDLQVGDVGSAAQVVVPHQPVEVEGAAVPA